ncbi:DUF192 domain-containing protein [Gilvimarinus chinensis]|uniref:DUF192 domain-containing protein n=1 Tax=Gilvimarinus chinensis TaxID=396005 RepID=UPI000379317B|nr:DUF192 domain-containing protein [Gilvimarinus chinensis]
MRPNGIIYIHHNEVLFDKVYMPRGFFSRARGLLARAELEAREGMFFMCCNAVHMLFMTRSIDIIFLDRRFFVTSIVVKASPYRFYRDSKAFHTLECKSGITFLKGIKVGQKLTLEEI